MTWFLFCYWYEPDAPRDPVGLVRMWTLARQLADLGDPVTVFPPRYASAKCQTGFQTVAVPLLSWPVLRPLSYVAGSFVAGLLIALWHKPAVVYYRWMASPHPILIARMLGSLCVCEVNGEPVPDWSGGRTGIGGRLRHWMAGQALRRCHRLVVLTEGLRDLVVGRYGVAAERVAVLPSGTDTELFAPRDRRVCRRLAGLESQAEYVGFVGSFYQYQGLDCLLDAFVRVRHRRPSARLLLVGDGETAQSLRERAARLGLGEAVIWTGRVPYAQVPNLIGAMDVCVAPFCGDRGETSPVKLFDYLACGRPAVASAIPSVSRVFTDRRGVVLVPPDDPTALATSLLTLLEHPESAGEIGQRGREFVEHRYSWSRLTRELRDWLQRDPAPAAHANPGLL
ncbi:MAG: glycosyltransferase family 4 protein [Nitrospiraceae bacterium]